MLYASSSPQSASSHSAAAQARRGAQHMVLAFVVNAVVSAPAKFVALLIERHRTVRTIAQLEALPDRLLADIGIERPEIASVVRQSRS